AARAVPARLVSLDGRGALGNVPAPPLVPARAERRQPRLLRRQSARRRDRQGDAGDDRSGASRRSARGPADRDQGGALYLPDLAEHDRGDLEEGARRHEPAAGADLPDREVVEGEVIATYVTRRVLLLLPVLLGVSLGSFALLHLVPGDPAVILAGQEATEEGLARIGKEPGPDQPLAVQFTVSLGNAVRGNLGISIQSRQPVATLIAQRFPFTLRLAFLAILVSAALGVVAGVIAATRRNSIIDIAALLASLVGISLPLL